MQVGTGGADIDRSDERNDFICLGTENGRIGLVRESDRGLLQASDGAGNESGRDFVPQSKGEDFLIKILSGRNSKGKRGDGRGRIAEIAVQIARRGISLGGAVVAVER